MRKRLNNGPVPSYDTLRNSANWYDHWMRVHVTAGVVASLSPESIIDPACGDGWVVKLTRQMLTWNPMSLVSDISSANYEYNKASMLDVDVRHGDMFDVMRSQNDGSYDVAILSETLEHIEDPDALLREARRVARRLVASSPCGWRTGDDDNPEHLWQFDVDGYRDMLVSNGWKPVNYITMFFPEKGYDFQVWVCE